MRSWRPCPSLCESATKSVPGAISPEAAIDFMSLWVLPIVSKRKAGASPKPVSCQSVKLRSCENIC